MYRGSPGILQVAGRARGRLESWDKWSFAGEQVSWGGADLPGWRPVRKLISRFSPASGHSRTRARGLGEEPGCHVELTEVHMSGQAWWTLGFEATGPGRLLRSELDATAAFVFSQPLPGGMELGGDDPSRAVAYPRPGSQRHRRLTSAGIRLGATCGRIRR